MKGIYMIICTGEDKVYIGQTNNIKKRFNYHIEKLRLRKHPNSYLQEAFNIYGEDSFVCKILHEVDDESFNRDELYELEKKYISLYDSTNRLKGYNIESGGLGAGRASYETCKKLSESHKGLKHSLETRQKFSIMRKGKPSHWRGKKQTLEHSKKRAEQQIGKVWVNNGKESRFVTKEDAEKLLNDGYRMGRPFFKRVKGKKYNYKDGFYTISQISNMCGIKKEVLSYRLRSGWSIDKATTEPINKRG